MDAKCHLLPPIDTSIEALIKGRAKFFKKTLKGKHAITIFNVSIIRCKSYYAYTKFSFPSKAIYANVKKGNGRRNKGKEEIHIR